MSQSRDRGLGTILIVGGADWLQHVDDAVTLVRSLAPTGAADLRAEYAVVGPVPDTDAIPDSAPDVAAIDCIVTDDPAIPAAVSAPAVIVGPAQPHLERTVQGENQPSEPTTPDAQSATVPSSDAASTDPASGERPETAKTGTPETTRTDPRETPNTGATESDAHSRPATDRISGHPGPSQHRPHPQGERTHLERALENGATDVVHSAVVGDPAMLARRLNAVLPNGASMEPLEESWYRRLLEQSPGTSFVVDVEGTITYASPSADHVTGHDPETLLGTPFESSIHPDDRDRVREALERVSQGERETKTTCEYTYHHGDGSWRVHEAEFTNYLDGPVIGGIVVTAQDITGYRLVEQELNESFQRVTDSFLSLDAEGRITYCNDQAATILDVSKADLLGQPLLEAVPELEDTAFEAEATAAMTTQESRTIESYYEPLDSWIEARLYPSTTGLSIYFRNVSTRVKREQALTERSQQLSALIEHAPVILFALDGDGVFTLSEGRALGDIGLQPGEVVGRSIYDIYEHRAEILEAASDALDGESVHTIERVDDRLFETWYRPVGSEGDVDRVIGIGVDVTERQEYEETLNTLYEATQHLLAVDSKQSACEYIVDVATEVIGLPNVAVFRFDSQENELVPASYTNTILTEMGPLPTFGPGTAITWEAFVSGETVVHDDIRDSEHVYDQTTAVRSGLFVPLGEHGVLVAFSKAAGAYDDRTVDLAQLFGATAEAALDRISRTQRLHEREQELKRQNEHLETLNRASSLREAIESQLLRADSRSAIESAVCDRLTDTDACAYAWIGEPDPGGNQLLRREDAGYGRGYLEAISVTAVDDEAAEPAGRAARTGDPTYVANVGTDLRRGPWRAEALSRDFQSVFAVPLVYDGFLYGVLAGYATEPDGFEAAIRSILSDLGETVAYAIDAVQRKQALLGDHVTEIELEITTRLPLSALADAIGTSVALEGLIPQDDGSTVVFASVEGAVECPVPGVDGVSALSVVGESGDRTIIQLTAHGEFLTSVVDSHGGSVRTLQASPDGVTRATITVPRHVDVRTILTDINRRGVSATMVARRDESTEHDLALGPPGPTYQRAILSALTERQREVVQAAYHGGFFEWPRESTGEELADSLDISPPAFHNHVRTAELKLFTELFEHDR